MPPSHPARHVRPPLRNMRRESIKVVLPTRSSTASICFRSGISSERLGVSISARLRASAVTDGDAFGEIEVIIGVSNGTIGAWQGWQWLTQIYVPSGDYDCGRICQW